MGDKGQTAQWRQLCQGGKAKQSQWFKHKSIDVYIPVYYWFMSHFCYAVARLPWGVDLLNRVHSLSMLPHSLVTLWRENSLPPSALLAMLVLSD